jgi:E3 ubiquitin-protein ligase TRIP12
MEAPGAVLRDGGLAAVLAYLDFFAVAVQRKAVEAAAHMCRGATADLRVQVEGSLDSLLRLLE